MSLLLALLSTSLLADEITMSTTYTAPIAAYQEIQDTSHLSYLNPDLKTRKIGKIRLPNGLEALLISDPGADQSSASMAVHAGSWNDPEEFPGMAHFCEHMVFMGSEKYPDNEFSKYVADAGGKMNAFTAPDRTVYMFSSKESHFFPILDRFAHFFIDPTFDQQNVSRELHAVDQEFAKNLEHDGWREYMILKELSAAGHPNQKFSTGNAETLGHIPTSALKSWHQAHYGAQQMKLFVYSNAPLQTMKAEVAAIFSDIPSLDQPTTLPHQPILSKETQGSILFVKPIKNKQSLSLTWELPPHLSNEPSKAAELIAYALNRGQEHSLYEALKKEELIDGLLIQSDDLGAKQNGSISFNLELSPKGMAQYRSVIQKCYEAIAQLKVKGIPTYLFEEKNQIARLGYEYQSREDAFQMAQSIGRTLLDEELASYPRKLCLAETYNREAIEEIVASLTPENCMIVMVASPSLSLVQPDRKEKWMGAEYALKRVDHESISAWSKAQPNDAIRIADPNPFIPAHLAAAPIDQRDITPVLISETEGGIAYYCRAPEFASPEASLTLSIRTPLIEPNPKSAVLLSLYLDHLTDTLNPITTAAQSASLTPRFGADRGKLRIQIFGFSEKAPLLLKKIVKGLKLSPPTRSQFELYVARHEKAYSNGSKELPYRQAKELLDSLLLNDRPSQAEQLAALKTITYEEYLKFQEKLFEKTYSEALFAGNLSFKEAEGAWIDVQHMIGKGIYPKRDHIQSKVLELPDQGGPFAIPRATDVQGNAAILAVDEGSFSFPRRSAQEILSPALREAFFNELRTKQKTGYITAAEPMELEERLFHLFLVQSNSHQPEDLLYRYELFLEEYLHGLSQNISEERFNDLKKSAIHSLTTRYRNLQDKAALWNLLAFEKKGDFEYIQKRIAALQGLTYEQFLKIVPEMLSRTNTKRLAVLYEGRLAAPFVYAPIDTPRLLELGRYVAKEERTERVEE